MGSEEPEQIGDYLLLRPLGSGGMGRVFLGQHLGTGAQHAVKVLERALDAQALLRFRREAQALAALGPHAHLIPLHGYGEAAGRPWLAMGLAPGGDLAERLAREGPLPPEEARRVVADVARGLAHAHARGVLHRDVKPANVVFDERGAARLTDFGLAHLVDPAERERLTRTGDLLGTPSYMAPEQANGQPADVRSDVYGLGALLYHALTGRPPFRGATPLNTLQQVLREPPVPPSRLREGIPPDLEATCLRALAKRPGERFPDATALAEALEHRTPDAGRGAGPAALAAAALALLAVGAVGVGLAWRAPTDDGPPATTPSAPARTSTPRPSPTVRAPETLPQLRERIARLAPAAGIAALESARLERFPAAERARWARNLLKPIARHLRAPDQCSVEDLRAAAGVLGLVARIDPGNPARDTAWPALEQVALDPDFTRGQRDPDLVLALARAYADRPRALYRIALTYNRLGELGDGRRRRVALALAEAARPALAADLPLEERRYLLRLIPLLYFDAARFARCAEAAAQALEGWDGDVKERAGLHMLRARAAWRLLRSPHDAATVRRLQTSILHDAREAERLDRELVLGRYFVGEVWWARGEKAAALAALERFCREARPVPLQSEIREVYSRAVARLWQLAVEVREPERARVGIEKMLDDDLYDPAKELNVGGWHLRRARLELEAGRPESARASLEQGIALIRRQRALRRYAPDASDVVRLLKRGDPTAGAALRRLLVRVRERWPLGSSDPR